MTRVEVEGPRRGDKDHTHTHPSYCIAGKWKHPGLSSLVKILISGLLWKVKSHLPSSEI